MSTTPPSATPSTVSGTVPATSPARAMANARTHQMLEAAITPTLLRLAAPTMIVMVLQTSATVLDAYYISWLGADALAGVTLVFPLAILMQTMAAAGMGGGVSSAVARALGGGRREDANALVIHALLIAAAMSALFTIVMLWSGRWIYTAMGGHGAPLDMALAYSQVVFGGAIVNWLFNMLGSSVRGTGNMVLPAWMTAMSVTIYAVLSPMLVMGYGPFPHLGVAGAPTANLTAFGIAAAILAFYLFSGRGALHVRLRGVRIRLQLLRDILRVGMPSSLNPLLANLMLVLVTGLVGQFGALALAGFGIAARLDYVQIPLIFGFGAALVTMVGTNIGAGRFERAERTAWTGAALTGLMTGTIGLAGALAPHTWISLFSDKPEVHAVGAHYLVIVGPTYAFTGIGLALYFASQGAGRVIWPLIAACVRLPIAVGGGWIAIRWLGAGLTGLFVAVAVAFVLFGTTIGMAVKYGAWRRGAVSH